MSKESKAQAAACISYGLSCSTAHLHKTLPHFSEKEVPLTVDYQLGKKLLVLQLNGGHCFPAGICGQWTAALGDIWILKDAMQCNNPVPLSSEPRVLDASGGTIPVL